MARLLPWAKQLIDLPARSPAFTATAAGLSAYGFGASASELVLSGTAQAKPHSTTAHYPASQLTARVAAPQLHVNTIESLSRHNAQSSGTARRQAKGVARLIPEHAVDGLASGVARAFGQAQAGNATAPTQHQSLAAHYRSQEWDSLAYGLSNLAQGIALVLAPLGAGWAVARGMQWLSSAKLQGLAANAWTRGIAEVGTAALLAHSDPSALALRQRRPSQPGGLETKAVATVPHKQQGESPWAWLSGPAESRRLYAGWKQHALEDHAAGDPFAAANASVALGLIKQAVEKENQRAITSSISNGKPLVLSKLPAEAALLRKIAGHD